MASLVTSPITYIYIYISDKIAIESDEIPMKSELHVSYLIPFHIAQVAPGASKCRAVMCGRRTFGGPPGQLGKNGEKLGFF